MFTYRKETTDVDVDVQCFAFKVGNVVEAVLMVNILCVFQNEAKNVAGSDGCQKIKNKSAKKKKQKDRHISSQLIVKLIFNFEKARKTKN